MTDPVRWKTIDRIFAAALELPPSERDEYVRKTCAGEAELGAEVLGLLAAAGSDESVLDTFGDRPLQALWHEIERETHDDLVIGTSIGPYRIVDLLGHGGMGAVYLAERDGDFRQRVAVKMLRPTASTKDAVRRFVAERQILASLQHPNIARLIDGGTLPDSRPYLIMEYVDGKPITDFARDAALTIPDRLDLFTTVADAVQHAHAHLVVHRDIKPSNILVTDTGVVKLLDFGIARLLDPSGQLDHEHTKTGVRIMTPAYASPEQIAGLHTTTATDVYQLGVLLYELLTRDRPFPGDLSQREVERHIIEVEPPSPSTVVRRRAASGTGDPLSPEEPRHTARRLKGDLDTIVRKAMRKEPQSRYASAEQFCADVRSHLRGRPIAARPPTWTYRTGKFLRRNRWAIPTAAVLAVAAGTYAITLERHANRLANERNVAQEESAKAREIQEFLAGLYQSPNPWQPEFSGGEHDVTVVETLDEGARRVRTDFADRPSIQAALLGVISESYYGLDLVDSALSLRREALNMEMSLHGEHSAEVVESLRWLGHLTQRSSAGADSALAILEPQVELARSVHDDQPGPLARSLTTLGETFITLGWFDDAAKNLNEAITIYRAMADPPLEFGDALQSLSGVTVMFERFDEALELAEESVGFFDRKLGSDHAQTASARIVYAKALSNQWRDEEAVVEFTRGIQVLEGQLGPDHSYVLEALHSLAQAYIHLNAYPEAEELYRKLLDRGERRFGPVAVPVADDHQNLGVALRWQGKLDAAVRSHQRAFEVYTQVFSGDHYKTAFPLLSLSEIQLVQGQFGAAETSAQEAAEILGRTLSIDHYATAVARCREGRAAFGLGQVERAASLLSPVIEILRISTRVAPEYRTECLEALMSVYEASGQTDEVDRLRRAMDSGAESSDMRH